MPDKEKRIEEELISDALATELKILETKIEPTTDGDSHIEITAQCGTEEEPDIEWAAFGIIYALSGLSFTDARPRGISDMHYDKIDDWKADDMLRHLCYEKGELHFYADYVRGRMMKTTINIESDGKIILETVGRGQAATRWIPRLQGKKHIALVGE